jgi:hypothetical protein
MVRLVRVRPHSRQSAGWRNHQLIPGTGGAARGDKYNIIRRDQERM